MCKPWPFSSKSPHPCIFFLVESSYFRTQIPNSLKIVAPTSSFQSGITPQELLEALPESLLSKSVHLYWVDKSPSNNGKFTLTTKIEISGQVLLLRSVTQDTMLVDAWDEKDPRFHTNSRLVALERILTDPAHEDMLGSL